MLAWLLCASLFSLIGLTEQNGHAIPLKDVKVSAEETELPYHGEWVLNVEWRDEYNESENVSYDIEIVYTEQMTTVHSETIHLKANKTTYYNWKWTSPIPLQCTSHSVRIRRRDGDWTQFYEYTGRDRNPTKLAIYPQDQTFILGSNITFCCIVTSEGSPVSKSSTPEFPIRISNRTYITNPVTFNRPGIRYSQAHCDVEESSVSSVIFIGYPPDDQNLRCETRNLRSVQCHWEVGRKTHLTGERLTQYTLNGGICKFNHCESSLEQKVTEWTLIAKNPLGVKIITDKEDPRRRVWLRAPSEISHAANARDVTLSWRWDEVEYASFPMICQAMLNENIYNENFTGKGLNSIVLAHLQPFAFYTAKVRCVAHEHFYKWGDWSNYAQFNTTEDIPEAVDVWIHHSEQKTYALWMPLTPQQSNGMIREYKISVNNNRTHTYKETRNKQCHEISSENGKSYQIISVSARNSAGFSPPSTIIDSIDSGRNIKESRIKSNNGGFELNWEKIPNYTCGYVVEWFPTYGNDPCDVGWMKMPQIPTNIHPSGIKDGVKYTLSIFGCVDDAPVLLQRGEGYAVEQRPSNTVQNLKCEVNGRSIELSWDEVPLEQQRGFIQEYKVKTIQFDKIVQTHFTKERKLVLTLKPGSYTFNISALTSGGESAGALYKTNIDNKIEQMIVATVVGCSAATLVFIIITVLCFKKRQWLKKLFYPDIPKPKLAGKWATKGIYCTPITERYVKCEIQKFHSSECPGTSESPRSLDLISSKTTLLPAQHFYQNTCSTDYTAYYPSPLPCDKKLTSIIENPSYNMTTPDPMDVAQISDLPLEMEDSYIPVPQLIQNKKDSEGYKPHSTWPTNVKLQ